MKLRTHSGSIYEINFDDKTIGRIVGIVGRQSLDIDNDFLEYAYINISPFQAPEQIIGRSIIVELKIGKKRYIQTSCVEEIL